MGKVIGVALGAGITSAVLFMVSATASWGGLLLTYVAPLPIMIAGLGFTHPAGAIAALVGGGTVGVALGPIPGLVFFLLLGLPAWYLARLGLLGRPVRSEASGSAPPAIEWYPVAQLLLRLAAVAAGPVLLASLVVIWRFGGYQHAVAALAARLGVLFGRDRLPGDIALADLVEWAPVAMAASSVLMLSVNLWLAARVVAISDRLGRPWPNLPDAITFPRAVAGAFLVCAVATAVPGPVGLVAGVFAAALGMLFVFEGLAAAHVLTRGLPPRRATLAAVYLTVVFLLPWPLFALALLGCIDCLVPLRGRGRTIRKPRS